MQSTDIISLIQEVGLGVALALVITFQLRRVLEQAADERRMQAEERDKLITHLLEEGRDTREVLRGLDRTLAEIRGALMSQRSPQESQSTSLRG